MIHIGAGATGACPLSTQRAARFALGQGAIVVAGSGNAGQGQAMALASCQNVVGVAAADSSGAAPAWSNVGVGVDVVAPGVDIISTVNPAVNNGAEYALSSGTSMSGPHVAGIAALLWSASPGSTALAIRARLLASSLPVSGAGSLWFYGASDAGSAIATTAPALFDPLVTEVDSPFVVKAGKPMDFAVTVVNEGTAPASFTVSLTDDPVAGDFTRPLGPPRGTLVASQEVTSLGVGATATVTLRWNTTRDTIVGPHTVYLAAAAGAVPLNIKNRVHTRYIDVVPLIDLAVVAARCCDPVPGSTIRTIVADITNYGGASATTTVVVSDLGAKKSASTIGVTIPAWTTRTVALVTDGLQLTSGRQFSITAQPVPNEDSLINNTFVFTLVKGPN